MSRLTLDDSGTAYVRDEAGGIVAKGRLDIELGHGTNRKGMPLFVEDPPTDLDKALPAEAAI